MGCPFFCFNRGGQPLMYGDKLCLSFLGIIEIISYICTYKGIIMAEKKIKIGEQTLSEFVKHMRRLHSLTQVELSVKSGVGLRFVRELEQGKQTLRLDKVNMVLSLFGAHLVAYQPNMEIE